MWIPARRSESGQSPQAAIALGQQFLDLTADCDQLRRRAHTIGPGFGRSGFDLSNESGHADHEELVQVRAEDGEELQSFQKRIRFILRFIQNPVLKREQAEFAIDIERPIVESGREFSDGALGSLRECELSAPL